MQFEYFVETYFSYVKIRYDVFSIPGNCLFFLELIDWLIFVLELVNLEVLKLFFGLAVSAELMPAFLADYLGVIQGSTFRAHEVCSVPCAAFPAPVPEAVPRSALATDPLHVRSIPPLFGK
jgi:hypothetical protein